MLEQRKKIWLILMKKIATLAPKDLDNSEISANFALNMTSHASR